MRVRLLLPACALLFAGMAPAFGQATTTPPAHGGMTPEMRAQMTAFARDLLIMTQNTATVTPTGVIVLQGNRLLQYDNNMRLVRTVPLPLPQVVVTPPATPGATPGQELRSMVSPRILVAANGDIVVVRGRQLVRMAPDLRVINSAALPELPALTTTEVAAIVPLAMYIEMMSMAGMGGGVATGTTPTAAAPPAGGPVVAPIADEE